MNTNTSTYTTAMNYLMLDCNYSSVQARALLAPLVKLACKAQNKELVATLANRVFHPGLTPTLTPPTAWHSFCMFNCCAMPMLIPE